MTTRARDRAARILAVVTAENAQGFPDDTLSHARELIAHGEPGLAVDILCTQLYEYDLAVSGDLVRLLEESVSLMDPETVALIPMLRRTSPLDPA
jgi:hypothetical protein